MEIDARGLRHPEPLSRLKEALEDPRSVGEPVFILVDSAQEAKRIETKNDFRGLLACPSHQNLRTCNPPSIVQYSKTKMIQ